MPATVQPLASVPSGIGQWGGGGAGVAGVAEVTDGTNAATGNVELVGAGLASVVVTPGVNGKATITGLEPAQVFYVPPSGDSTYVTDTAAIKAIQAAQGSAPYLIVLGASTYYIAAGGLSIFGRSQGLTGQGSGQTVLQWQGGTNGAICIQAYDSSFSSSASIAGTFGGFRIACQASATGQVGFQFGNLLHARCYDISIYGVDGTGSIGFYLHNGPGAYSEEGAWRDCLAVVNSTGVVFDTGSFDYSIFEFLVVALSGQNGVMLQNAAILAGTRFELRGNFASGAGNTGIVLGIDANGGGVGTSQIQGVMDVMVECDGSSTGHQAYNFGGGSASQTQGVGQFRFQAAPANFAAGACDFEAFAFTGQISVPNGSTNAGHTIGVVGQGVGLVTVGATLKNDNGFIGINPIYLGSGDIFSTNLSSGANTLSFSQVPTYAQTIEFLVVQPSSGAAGTITWPAGVYFPHGAGALSSANNAVDMVRLTYHPSVNSGSWWGTIALNLTLDGA